MVMIIMMVNIIAKTDNVEPKTTGLLSNKSKNLFIKPSKNGDFKSFEMGLPIASRFTLLIVVERPLS